MQVGNCSRAKRSALPHEAVTRHHHVETGAELPLRPDRAGNADVSGIRRLPSPTPDADTPPAPGDHRRGQGVHRSLQLTGQVNDSHVQALLEIARKRQAEPIDLEDDGDGNRKQDADERD